MSTIHSADRASEVSTSERLALLTIRDLWIRAHGDRTAGDKWLVRGLSLSVRRGEVVAIVGESGSGKSTACLAIPRLLASNLRIERGSIEFDGVDLSGFNERQMRKIRGDRIGMIFQDPLAVLNPVRKVGKQLVEARRLHGHGDRRSAREWAVETLRSLGFGRPEHALQSYPHAFSGGMRQRLCVGIAFSAEPDLVIADEPTTSLDISLQGRLLRILLEKAAEHDTATLLVSHDVSVVKAVADRMVVMYGGRALEAGPTATVLSRPTSPYTTALMRSIPTMEPSTRGHRLPTIAGDSFVVGSEAGCPFAARCDRALEQCTEEFPEVTKVDDSDHYVWCWNPVSAS